MDNLKLEAFVAVAEEESFSAAADRIHVAQSTISARIKELESQLGQRLFARTSRQVRLSPAGAAALPAARTALAALASVHQVVDDIAGIRRGRVRLGLVTGADLPGLGATLAAFATEFPDVELLVVSGSTADLEQAVSDGTLDVAVVVRTGATRLRWREMLCDPLIVLGLPAATDTVSITSLNTETLILLDAGAGARAALDSAARQAGVRLNIAVQVSTPRLAQDLYALGMGRLIIPSSFAPDEGRVLVDSEGAQISVRVGLISHPEMRTPVTELLLERLATDTGLSGG